MLNTSWSFEVDTLHSFAYWNLFLTPEECSKVIKYGNSLMLKKALTRGGDSSKVRKSEVSWIYPNPEINWLFERTTSVIQDLNSKYFKFDLHGFNEGFQFTRYKAPGGKYGAHIDRGLNQAPRKLSLTVQLSDPKNYKGGEFKIIEGLNNEAEMYPPNEQGTLIAFPSFALHEVMPVTKGERYSLVAWITGPNFK